jgi:phenylalanyl-tRNA synthetase beta chain
MKIPLSWIKDFVEIELPIEELVRQLTMAGLEVEEIIFVGLPIPSGKV